VSAGDVIVSAAGRRTTSVDDLALALAAKRPGDRIELGLRRSGGPRRVTVTLGELPAH
jgi:putative serine protease PepD